MEVKLYKWRNAEWFGEDSEAVSRQIPGAPASYINTWLRATDGFEFNTCKLPQSRLA